MFDDNFPFHQISQEDDQDSGAELPVGFDCRCATSQVRDPPTVLLAAAYLASPRELSAFQLDQFLVESLLGLRLP